MIVVVVIVEGIYDWITEVSTYASPHKVMLEHLLHVGSFAPCYYVSVCGSLRRVNMGNMKE